MTAKMRFHDLVTLVTSDLSIVNGNVICWNHTPFCGIAPNPGAKLVQLSMSSDFCDINPHKRNKKPWCFRNIHYRKKYSSYPQKNW